ncbi:DUF485 domain-containing protein [Saccharopolyspora indica]|uniref:DUF485 domain-containing protein n=2 Tax=Saccharopolyspora indica TaxID=1229659 RepID=UPI002FE62704
MTWQYQTVTTIPVRALRPHLRPWKTTARVVITTLLIRRGKWLEFPASASPRAPGGPTAKFQEGSMSNATQSALRGSPGDQPGNPRSAFGGIDKSAVRPTAERLDFRTIEESPEFRALRRRLKWFVFPATAFFLIWYIGYVAVAAYAREFMARPLIGEINVGLVLGVAQFITTVGLTMLYLRFARRHIDPKVDELRQDAGDLQR